MKDKKRKDKLTKIMLYLSLAFDFLIYSATSYFLYNITNSTAYTVLGLISIVAINESLYISLYERIASIRKVTITKLCIYDTVITSLICSAITSLAYCIF